MHCGLEVEGGSEGMELDFAGLAARKGRERKLQELGEE